MPRITPINPGDLTLDYTALDRLYTRERVLRHLIEQGVTTASNGDRLYRHAYRPFKPVVIATYLAAIKAEAAPEAHEAPVEHPDVQIVKRVLLKGKDCSDSYSHTVGMELIDGGTRVRVLQDGECDPEDSEKFHTTLAGLKAAVAALEAQV